VTFWFATFPSYPVADYYYRLDFYRNDSQKWGATLQAHKTMTTEGAPDIAVSEAKGLDSHDVIRDAALKAILESDGAPISEHDEEDGDADRKFSGPCQWKAFCNRAAAGSATLSCVIDFAYADIGGLNLKGNARQLERMYCFHDPHTGNPEELLVVVHVHTTEKWGDRRKQQSGRQLQRFTSVNARHAHMGAVNFKQEYKKFHVVPKNKELCSSWRTLPEEHIIWIPKDGQNVPTVPSLDREHSSWYASVGQVIAAGE